METLKRRFDVAALELEPKHTIGGSARKCTLALDLSRKRNDREGKIAL